MKGLPIQNINREAQFAGQFYPADKETLVSQLSNYFEKAKNTDYKSIL